MIEPELGAMAKRIVTMAEDRCSDYAVGKAVMELVEMAMNASIKRHFGEQLLAEKANGPAELLPATESIKMATST